MSIEAWENRYTVRKFSETNREMEIKQKINRTRARKKNTT